MTEARPPRSSVWSKCRTAASSLTLGNPLCCSLAGGTYAIPSIKTARVHHAARRRGGGGVAARGKGAAADATHWRSDGGIRERSRVGCTRYGLQSEPREARLDDWPQSSD